MAMIKLSYINSEYIEQGINDTVEDTIDRVGVLFTPIVIENKDKYVDTLMDYNHIYSDEVEITKTSKENLIETMYRELDIEDSFLTTVVINNFDISVDYIEENMIDLLDEFDSEDFVIMINNYVDIDIDRALLTYVYIDSNTIDWTNWPAESKKLKERLVNNLKNNKKADVKKYLIGDTTLNPLYIYLYEDNSMTILDMLGNKIRISENNVLALKELFKKI